MTKDYERAKNRQQERIRLTINKNEIGKSNGSIPRPCQSCHHYEDQKEHRRSQAQNICKQTTKDLLK